MDAIDLANVKVKDYCIRDKCRIKVTNYSNTSYKSSEQASIFSSPEDQLLCFGSMHSKANQKKYLTKGAIYMQAKEGNGAVFIAQP